MWVPYKNYTSVLYWYFARKGRKVRKTTKLPKVIRVTEDRLTNISRSIEDRLAIIPFLPSIRVKELYSPGERIVIPTPNVPDHAYRLAMNTHIRKAIEVLAIMGYDVLGIIELLKDQLNYYVDIEPENWQQAISDYLFYFWDIDKMADMDWAYFFMKCIRGDINYGNDPYQYMQSLDYTDYGFYNTHASAYYGLSPAYETLLEIRIDVPQLGLQSLLTGLIKRTIMKYDRSLRLNDIEGSGHWSLVLHRLAKSYSELVESPADDYVRLLTDELEMVENKDYKIYTPEELRELPASSENDSSNNK